MEIKKGLYYSEDHEWVRVEGDTAYVGITDYAQNALGDIVYVELPAVDSAVEARGQVGVLESVKAVADLFSPISGSVIGVNEQVEASPELLNSDPYGSYIFEVALEGGLDDLMDADAYAAYLKTLD